MAEKTEGILLSKVQHTSGAFVLNFLTRNEGLKAFYFRGGQKKGGALFPLSQGTIIYSMRTAGLPTMSAYEFGGNGAFTADPRKVALAFFIAELVAKCTAADNPDPFLFDSVRTLTDDLNRSETFRDRSVKYMTALMAPLGIAPSIQADSGSLVLDLSEGIIRHGQPSELTPGGEVIQCIVDFLKYDEIKSTGIIDYQKALDILLTYYAQHYPAVERLKSLEVLREAMH